MYSKVVSLIKMLDLNSSSNFIRFNGDDSYSTVFGGLLSLFIISVFIGLFANTGLMTLNQEIISSTTDIQIDLDPTAFTINNNPSENFMFSVGLFGFNLSDPHIKLFNISLNIDYYSPLLKLINTTQIPLQMCTSDHFNFNTEMLNMYTRLNMSYLLCPPLGSKFTL